MILAWSILYCDGCKLIIFSNSSTFSIFDSWDEAFFYVSPCGFMNSYFFGDLYLFLSLILVLQLPQILPVRFPSSWLLSPCAMSPSLKKKNFFRAIFFTFWQNSLTLYFCPSPGQALLLGAWCLLLDSGIKDQDLSTSYAQGFSALSADRIVF